MPCSASATTEQERGSARCAGGLIGSKAVPRYLFTSRASMHRVQTTCQTRHLTLPTQHNSRNWARRAGVLGSRAMRQRSRLMVNLSRPCGSPSHPFATTGPGSWLPRWCLCASADRAASRLKRTRAPRGALVSMSCRAQRIDLSSVPSRAYQRKNRGLPWLLRWPSQASRVACRTQACAGSSGEPGNPSRSSRRPG